MSREANSRIANSPVDLPQGVEVTIGDGVVSVKGGKGSLQTAIHEMVEVTNEDNQLKFTARKRERKAVALAGTMRSLVNGMVVGVSEGFEKKLEITGVGYRAKASDKTVNISVGYSHPIDYQLPEGVTAESPSQTELVLKGADKQLLGQVAAEIRKMRPPEPYKGKGIRYSDEYVNRKEAKKK